MADVITGYHWSETSPEKITGAKLNLTGSGTVTNITAADLGSGFTGITIGTAAPTPSTGKGWFDTTQGAGNGILKFYDNGKWAPVAQGFLGFNTGTTLSRGHIVQYDSATLSSTAGVIPVSKTQAPSAGVVQLARARGVAAESIANGATGVIISTGYCEVLKETGTVTGGDLIVPSSTVGASSNGRGESGNVGSWGTTGGHAAIGRWLNTSSAVADTLVSAFIFPPSGSWTAFKNNGGTAVYSGVTVTATAGESWTGTNSFSTNVPGTIAHICEVRLNNSNAAVAAFAFGLRMVNASVTENAGAAYFGGNLTGGAGVFNYARAQLIVPETTGAGTNQLQYSLASSDTTASRFTLTVFEVGVVIGGSIV